GCNLVVAPCAAYAPDYAIVVNLQDNKDWYTVEVKTAGEKLTLHSIVKVTFEPESSLYETEVLHVRFKGPDSWVSFIQLPDQEKTVWKLRVSVERENNVMVAEYPLP
ncbi:MAG: hypothetical protein HKP55_11845, partial [Gammaproteobacteria bacterium]|nr:hypothetical protein [Gammaproteobacteria bacterium]